jgi:mono/diheme cytochrome c family protein
MKYLLMLLSAIPLCAQTTKVTYLNDVRPIFMARCVRCHNYEARFMYDWLDYKKAYSDRYEIRRRVWDAWNGEYYKQSMPAGNSPEHTGITEAERKLIKQWVDQGAKLGVLPASSSLAKTKEEKIEQGQKLFSMICVACHQPDGKGLPGQFPPLAHSDFLNQDKQRAIKVLVNGRQGEIQVNGMRFNGAMPMFPLTDKEIADVLTYVYSAFGNSGQEVSVPDVKSIRALKEPVVSYTQVANKFE